MLNTNEVGLPKDSENLDQKMKENDLLITEGKVSSGEENELDLIEKQKFLNKNQNTNIRNYSTIRSNEIHSHDETQASIIIKSDSSTWDLYKGLIYMLASCIFKSLFSVLSKFSLQYKTDLSSFQLLTFRTYFMLWINLLVVLFGPVRVFSSEFITKSKIIPLIWRTVLAIISMSFVIFSLKYLHISDVYSVYYLYPGLIILLSLCFTKDKAQLSDIICLIMCFIGALMIIKPDFTQASPIENKKESNIRMIMFGLVFGAAILKASEDIIVREAGKEVHYLAVPFFYACIGIVLFPIPMIIFDKKYPSFTFFEVVNVFLIGLTTYLYQAFMALGLQNENAGRVSLVNYFQVALMYLSDITFFGKGFQLLDFFGTVLIFGCNIINGVIKCKSRYEKMEKIKNKESN